MKQTDGRAITNPENAQSFTHAEIKQAADEMNPDGLASAFDAWSKIATAVKDAGHQFETAIKQAIEQHWEGAAADSAVRGIRDYATQVGEFGDTLNAQTTPLSQAASAAAKFKLSVPDVVDTSTNPRGPELRNSSEEQARDDMTTQYIQPYGTTAPAIPTLPPPISPISVTPPGGDSSIDPGASPGPTKTQDSSSSSTEDSSKQAPPDKADTSDKASDTGTSKTEAQSEDTAPQSVSTDKTNDPSTTPAATTTAATTPKSPTTTTSPFSAGPISTAIPTTTTLPSATVTPASVNGTPSRSGTPTSSGHPNTSATPNTSASPNREARQGTSRPPVPATAPVAAGPQSAATPGRTGAPGTAGYPGMFPHGARSRGDDDGEHKSPGFLRTEEHAKELLGEVEKTVPPVLGEK